VINYKTIPFNLLDEKFQSGETGFFLFLFFFRINVLTSSLTVVSRSLRISRIKSPSEDEAVDKASGDLRAIMGELRGVSKSSKDKGLVTGLLISLALTTVASAEAIFEAVSGALIC